MLNSGEFGVALGNEAVGCEVTNNYIDGVSNGNCIDTGSAMEVKIIGNTCLNTGFDGIDIDMQFLNTAATNMRLMIHDNYVRACGRWGIIVGLPFLGGGQKTGVSICDNMIDDTVNQGILLINSYRGRIQNNTVRNAGGAGGFFGSIAISNSAPVGSNTSRNNLVQGNVCLEDRAVKVAVGWSADVDTDYTILTGNDFSGCAGFGSVATLNEIRANNR
jgi:parallel beta-helix repeat protein